MIDDCWGLDTHAPHAATATDVSPFKMLGPTSGGVWPSTLEWVRVVRLSWSTFYRKNYVLSVDSLSRGAYMDPSRLPRDSHATS